MNRDLKVRGGAAAVLAILFAAGTALGLAVARERRPGEDDFMPAEGLVSAGRSQPSQDWMIDRLALTPAQRTAIDSVVEHFGARMSSLQKEYRPRYRAIVDSASQALRALLDEEQRARYDSLQATAKRGFEETPGRDVP
jgi:hypothetical protein